MLCQNQAAKACNCIKTRDKYRFTSAFGENSRISVFSKPVQNMNSIGDPNPYNKREGHNVGGIKRDVEQAHDASHPDRTNRHGKQSKEQGGDAAEMNQHHDDN